MRTATPSAPDPSSEPDPPDRGPHPTTAPDGTPLHAICHQTHAELRAALAAALADRDTRATADERVGQAVRRLTQPGVKRKTIRISELRDLIDSIDAQPQPIRPCGHCLGDPPTNHQCPACGRTA